MLFFAITSCDSPSKGQAENENQPVEQGNSAGEESHGHSHDPADREVNADTAATQISEEAAAHGHSHDQ